MEFWRDLPTYPVLQTALLCGLLVSVASGVVGSYVVVRRITYIAAGIAHCVLGGMGAARYFATVHNVKMYDPRLGWVPLDPLLGALAAALLAAIVIGWVSLYAKQREDTVISAIWSIGMAAGVIFIAQTPGYNQDLMSYLFGNILMIRPQDLWLLVGLDVVVIAAALLFYHRFLAVCFDAEFAALRGIRVERWYILLLMLTAVTVVLLVSVVGIVLVIALLTLPVAIAGRFTRTLGRMMALAVVLSAILTTAGLALSYGPDLPPGATTVVLAGAAYLAVALAGVRRRAV